MAELPRYAHIKPGDRFGKLVVVAAPIKVRGQRPTVLCRCECGKEKAVNAFNLMHGQSSCGCVGGRYRHGLNRAGNAAAIYKVWSGIIQRCTNPKAHRYDDYGGRGITVCEAWRDAATFCEWATASGYRKGLKIDRIDNAKGYEPGNCRWITNAENNRNKRTTFSISAWGETKCVTEWGRDSRCSVSIPTIILRIKKGLAPEEAISLPRQMRSAFLLNRIRTNGTRKRH